LSKDHAKQLFGEGRLVESYNEAYAIGATQIFLLRIEGVDFPTELDKAYSLIEDLYMHIIVPVNVYMDDPSYDYSLQLAKHCFKANSLFGNRIGIIGVNPLTPADIVAGITQEDVFNHVNTLLSNTRMQKGFFNENQEDIGNLISVVVSEPVFRIDAYKDYTVNGATVYAGLLSAIPSGYSPTNYAIYSAQSLRYDYPLYNVEDLTLTTTPIVLKKKPEDPVTVKTRDGRIFYRGKNSEDAEYLINTDNWTIQAVSSGRIPSTDGGQITVVYSIDDVKALTNAGYVVFSNQGPKGIVIESGITPTKEQNYKFVQSTRILQSIIYTIKNAGDEVIGQSIGSSNEFEQFVRDFLQDLVISRQIKDFSVVFNYPSYDTIEIQLTVVPGYEIRETTVAILID
jgi:hypothetical protein